MANSNFFYFTFFTIFILSTFVQSQETIINSRKLDESPPDLNKCGSCPCNQPCNPPPSPPPPSQPPPPPPKPKSPPSNYCPPPPSGGGGGSGGGGQYPPNPPNPPYIYINGPPGNLYPVYPYNSGSGRSAAMVGFVEFLIMIMISVVAFW